MATAELSYSAGAIRRPDTGNGSSPQTRHQDALGANSFRDREEESLAKFLGWFSIGLGAAEVIAPRAVGNLIGVKDGHSIIQLFGLREILAGVGILSKRRPTEWLWGRVGGDALDLAGLTSALFADDSDKGRVLGAIAAVAGVTALDLLCSEMHSERPRRDRVLGDAPAQSGIHVRKSTTVNSSTDELYRFWRNFENFPRFMNHVKSVKDLGNGRSHWVVRAPVGAAVEWDAEMTEDQPGKRIAWRSVGEAQVPNSGSAEFRAAPGNRGTEVHVELHYDPPAGTCGAIFARLFGQEPGHQLAHDLRYFKAFIETGEIPTTEGQTSGRGRTSMNGM